MKPKAERRSNTRVARRMPATVRLPGTEQVAPAETRDLSSHGAFFFTPARLEPGCAIELILIMPPEITELATRWVCCQGTVVRLEQGEDGQFGIAARIDRCEAMPEI